MGGLGNRAKQRGAVGDDRAGRWEGRRGAREPAARGRAGTRARDRRRRDAAVRGAQRPVRLRVLRRRSRQRAGAARSIAAEAHRRLVAARRQRAFPSRRDRRLYRRCQRPARLRFDDGAGRQGPAYRATACDCICKRERSMTTAPRKLRRTTLAGDAHAAVRDLLLGGSRYAPGEKISIEELSRDLGVSRSPIWTAVARLEAEGIVEVSPRQGVFLIGFEPERIRAVFEAREALEGMAARLAARRMTDDELAELVRTVARQTSAIERKSRATYDKANMDF